MTGVTAHGEQLQVCGISIDTLVDFTAATARTPGSSPSSSAASRLSSETKRCGPAWISTCAITASRTTRVTRPVKRLRTEWPTTTLRSGRSDSAATSSAKRASATPSTTCRPGRRH